MPATNETRTVHFTTSSVRAVLAEIDVELARAEYRKLRAYVVGYDCSVAEFDARARFKLTTATPTPRDWVDAAEQVAGDVEFAMACEGYAERYAEAGSSWVFGGGAYYDAGIAASQAAGPKPRRSEYRGFRG